MHPRGRNIRESATAKGRLFIVSGPSGAGKGTLVEELLKERPKLFLSISATTRRKRPQEEEGKDYYFIGEEAFRRALSEDKFLEYAEVHGNLYGTLRLPIEEQLSDGKCVILEIDVQGAEQVRRKAPEACAIFILPPSFEELRERLAKRGSEGENEIEKRLKRAREEMGIAGEYDFRIINDDLEKASRELVAIVDSESGEEQ